MEQLRRKRDLCRAAVVKTNETKKAERIVSEKERAARENSKRYELKQLQKDIGSLEAHTEAYEEQEKARLKKEEASASWVNYLLGLNSREPKVSEEQKRSQELERIQAIASHRIKTSQLQAKRQKLNVVQGDIARIAAIRTKIRTDLDKQAAQRLADMTRGFADEDKAWQQKVYDEARQQADKERQRDAERVRREFERQEQARKAGREQAERAYREQAEQTRREKAKEQNDYWDPNSGWEDYVKERRAREQEKVEKATRKAKSEQHKRSHGGQSFQKQKEGGCSHSTWWSKKFEPGSCAQCTQFHKAWLMECPECQFLACASCMHALKNGGRKR